MENIQLTALGLPEKEGRVYVALLESGSSSIVELAKRSRLNRVTVYAVLETLISQKLVMITYKGKRKVYTVETPENLKRQLQDRLSNLENILPQLLLMANTGHVKPRVIYREGIEGIKNVFRDALKAKEKTIVGISGIDALTSKNDALMTFLEKEFIPGRKKRQIIVRLVMPDTPAGKRLKSRDQDHLRESRLLPASSYSFESEIWVFDDTITFISYSQGEEFGLSIQSNPIANSFKMMWRVLWNQGY